MSEAEMGNDVRCAYSPPTEARISSLIQVPATSVSLIARILGRSLSGYLRRPTGNRVSGLRVAKRDSMADDLGMFDEKLPYRVYDADNHFYEPAGALLPYLEQRFHDKVAVDYTPGKAAQHAAKIRAQQEERQQVISARGGGIPGSTLGKANPLRDKTAEE